MVLVVAAMSAASSACRTFSCARRDWRSVALADDPVVAVVVAVEEPGVHESPIAALVFGPTAPYPVVAGEPDETMWWSLCHCLTAACVRGP